MTTSTGERCTSRVGTAFASCIIGYCPSIVCKARVESSVAWPRRIYESGTRSCSDRPADNPLSHTQQHINRQLVETLVRQAPLEDYFFVKRTGQQLRSILFRVVTHSGSTISIT